MEEDNKLVININDDEGITKVANALGNISELAVMFMYEIYKYGDMSEDEMETREKAFSGAMTIVFQSLFGEDNYDVAKMFIKKYDGIMRKKIEDLGDKAKESNMFDLDSLSDIVNPN